MPYDEDVAQKIRDAVGVAAGDAGYRDQDVRRPVLDRQHPHGCRRGRHRPDGARRHGWDQPGARGRCTAPRWVSAKWAGSSWSPPADLEAEGAMASWVEPAVARALADRRSSRGSLRAARRAPVPPTPGRSDVLLDDIADELYGLPPKPSPRPATPARRQPGPTVTTGWPPRSPPLRKPTAGAWLLNHLVPARGEVESVLELGIRLRAAQGTLGASDLRALDEQRRQLTRAVAVQAVAIATGAGRKVYSTQVAADVQGPPRSAMVDPDAQAQPHRRRAASRKQLQLERAGARSTCRASSRSPSGSRPMLASCRGSWPGRATGPVGRQAQAAAAGRRGCRAGSPPG